MPFVFNDRTLVTPATVSRIYDSRIEDRGAPLGVLALVGQALSVPPQEVTELTSYAEAENIFVDDRESNVKKAIQKAFNPSPDTGGPSKILFVNVNPVTAVPAALTLKDTSATPADCIKITAKKGNFGPQGASTTVKIEDGVPVNGFGTKKLTVTLNGKKTINDKVKRLLLKLTYDGAGAATATITATKLTVTIDTVNTDLLFSTYKTVQGLSNKLNTINHLNAAVVNNNGGAASTDLDAVTAQAIPPAGLVFTAQVAAMVTAINQMPGVTAERLPGAFPGVANIPATALVYTDPLDATLSDWQAGIDLLQRYDIDWVVPLVTAQSGTLLIQAMVADHVVFMSDTVNMERRAIMAYQEGAAAGDQDTNAIGYADTLRNDRVSLVHMGIYDLNDKGKLKPYPPHVLAAQIAGMMCGVRPGEPLTNKRIYVKGLLRWLLNPTETDPLIGGGVLLAWKDYSGEHRILQSISTAQAYDEDGSYNFYRNEMSVGAATDYLAKEIRKVADTLRGQKNTPYLPLELKARVEARLKQLAAPAPEGEGILVGDDNSPAFQGVTVTQGVDWLTVEFQASPVVPANYIGIVVHTAPYQGAGVV